MEVTIFSLKEETGDLCGLWGSETQGTGGWDLFRALHVQGAGREGRMQEGDAGRMHVNAL